jgi:hypothetical protein
MPGLFRTGGAIEGGEETVPQALHFVAAKPADLSSHRLVVAVEQRAPLPVAEFGGTLCRVDDVGEQHRRQHAIDFNLAA